MGCDCDVGRTCVALLTALANDETALYTSMLDELSDEQAVHAVLHLTGFVVGLLRQRGDPRRLMADLGPKLEALRG